MMDFDILLTQQICSASLCNTASYVDIRAKTDTYVGFLSSHALERLLEKRPIVLLTLAKRLISMLSPLGTIFCHSDFYHLRYCIKFFISMHL